MSAINPDEMDPFRFLDAKVAEFKADRVRLQETLHSLGWVLRPNHPLTGVWRARRWTKDGTLRLMSTSPDGLLELVREEHARRPRRRSKKGTEAVANG